MGNFQNVADEIEQIYRVEFLHPFPLEDLLKLKSVDPKRWDELHAYLDIDGAFIAGYCSSASRLNEHRYKELQRSKNILALPFFERHPDLKVFEARISEVATPELWKWLTVMEKLRLALLKLVEEAE